MATTNKTPSWLTVAADRVTVRLTKPTEANGMQVDQISLRSPTVRDIRAAQQGAGEDDEQRELNLFASLAEVGVKDLEGLALKDYSRLQTGYFHRTRRPFLQVQPWPPALCTKRGEPNTCLSIQ